PDLRGDHLEWLRARLHVVLTVGQGQWEDTTGAMASTVHMAGLLRDQGVRVDLDMWGHDVAHDWPWWQRQACHHVPRFC
ncbi:MAG TPA: esterase, partial [Dermatophilaceae bacterium]|nr:esterase [Dermatophilaceae bacterium]